MLILMVGLNAAREAATKINDSPGSQGKMIKPVSMKVTKNNSKYDQLPNQLNKGMITSCKCVSM